MKKEERIAKYCELKKKWNSKNYVGTFYAIDEDDKKNGIKKILSLRNGNEELVQYTKHLFGWKRYLDEMVDKKYAIRNMIVSECNPQDVYDYEYKQNNCKIDPCGDVEAIKTIINIFGVEIANKIKRKNKHLTIKKYEKNLVLVK